MIQKKLKVKTIFRRDFAKLDLALEISKSICSEILKLKLNGKVYYAVVAKKIDERIYKKSKIIKIVWMKNLSKKKLTSSQMIIKGQKSSKSIAINFQDRKNGSLRSKKQVLIYLSIRASSNKGVTA